MNSCETTEGAVSGLLASNRWRCVCYERDLYNIPLNTIPAYQQIAIAQKWIYLIFSLRVNTAMELTKVNPFCLNHSRNFRNLTKWLWSRVRRLGESWIRKLAKFDESRCRSIESQAWKIILHVGEMELGEFFHLFWSAETTPVCLVSEISAVRLLNVIGAFSELVVSDVTSVHDKVRRMQGWVTSHDPTALLCGSFPRPLHSQPTRECSSYQRIQ